ANFPDGIVTFLDRIGLLGPRLTLAHCTYARPDELDLIADRRATIAVNTSSNLVLRSGIAPLAEMVRHGCRVALGLDGSAFDEDEDVFREMRLAHLLHGGVRFDVKVDRAAVLAMASRNGGLAGPNRDDGGTLAPGAPADILLIDWNALDRDRLRVGLDPRDLLFGRMTARYVRELIVAGRTIVRDGQVTGVDLDRLAAELIAGLRADIGQNDALAAALPALE